MPVHEFMCTPVYAAITMGNAISTSIQKAQHTSQHGTSQWLTGKDAHATGHVSEGKHTSIMAIGGEALLATLYFSAVVCLSTVL